MKCTICGTELCGTGTALSCPNCEIANRVRFQYTESDYMEKMIIKWTTYLINEKGFIIPSGKLPASMEQVYKFWIKQQTIEP